MAGVPVAEPTPAAEATARAMDRAVAAAMEGRPLYPEGTEFVPADLPGLGRVLDRCARERLPVVLVYPDGHERLVAVLTRGERARLPARIAGPRLAARPAASPVDDIRRAVTSTRAFLRALADDMLRRLR